MKAFRFSYLLRKTFPLSTQKLLPFSSSSTAVKSPNFFCDEPDDGSPVYRHKLMFQRPTTMNWDGQLYNSVHFIGSVLFPLKRGASTETISAYTLLKVRSFPDSDRTFRILLKMWGKMAELSLQHLRPNDFIYVSGRLNSYTKVDLSGKLRTFYEVIVEELNYVAQSGQYETCKKLEQSEIKEKQLPLLSASDWEKKRKDRLYLWQVFFSNPDEWWDNRHGKVNPKAPHFKHKDTGEALWLSSSDPSWVTRQLQLHDSRMGGRRYQDSVSSRSRVSFWEYTDEEQFSVPQKKKTTQGS
ncbi:protein OSB1, mitochondrial [Macadamia integrifolia]|uniref:protein OSB1, mitochondrial n=1 Tax=Macadamia integrifolia TaxID=60698 RepID=UPI001C4F93DC|nr:protein OSB1, mitochondrial [Macadamia integrifolia]